MTRVHVFAGVALAALALAPAALGAEQRAASAAPATPAPAFAPDRVIVQWAAVADKADRAAARDDAEVTPKRALGDPDFQLLKVDPGQTPAEAIATLEDDPAVLVAEPDGYDAPQAVPNDPLFGQLWGLRNLGGTTGIEGFPNPLAGADVFALGAWARTVGTPSTVVADLDSGYRFEHPDLAGVAWTNPNETANGLDDDANGIVDDLHGADFVGASGDSPATDGNPTDDDLLSGGHGVHTAGTIGAAGNNGVGIAGVAQNARIMPLRVCGRTPSVSDSRCPTSSQIAAINYAGAKGARVANMSLGGTTSSQAVVNAFAANPQTLFVISAGNDSQDNEATPHYPCGYRPDLMAVPAVPGAIDNIVCVAATDQADGLAGFSDYGATSVDLGAPGTETLSSYPWDKPIDETFESSNFAAKWTASGGDGGFSRTGEAPLTSFGMSDSPGVAPPVDTVRESTSAAVALPAGYTSCTLNQNRTLSVGTGTYTYSVLLADTPVASSSPTSSGKFFLTLGNALQAGGQVKLRFRYSSGAGPLTTANGVWLDDINLVCAEPVGQSNGYDYLQGTSMAAPHVTGAAALLFSYKPDATVTEVRSALLAGVDEIPSLAGKTVTGGRLNASNALDAFDVQPPAAPHLTSTVPASGSNQNAPRVRGIAEDESTVALYANGSCSGGQVATGSAATLASPGIAVTVADNSANTFSARTTDTAGNVSPCSNGIGYAEDSRPHASGPPPAAVVSCKVPKLAGKSLSKAKKALKAAHCKLGKVKKPKKPKHGKGPALVVKSSSPKAGTELEADSKVGLKLKRKPAKKKRK